MAPPQTLLPDTCTKDELLNRLLDGRYRVLGKLGQGGMTAVYEVLDITTNVKYAAKVVLPEIIELQVALRELRDEFVKAQSFTHQNLLNYKFFANNEPIKFIIMELIDGENLEEYLSKKGGKITVPEATGIVIQILNGLNCFHEAGLVHLDLKPRNIMVSSSNKVKIIDFGISKSIQKKCVVGSKDKEEAEGTIHYMAPEQLPGKWKSSNYDCRTDIYALGLVCYQILAGKLPYEWKSTKDIIEWHLDSQHKCPTTCSTAFDQIIEKSLSVDPEQRFTNCGEIIKLLGYGTCVS